jgi:putative membrane protein
MKPKNLPSWRRTGSDPDYRFTLANERTFLAWLRTLLALIAGGTMLMHFSSDMSSPGLARSLAIGLCLISGLFAPVAYMKWRANEIAMREGRGLPHSQSILFFTAFVLAIGLFAGVLLR